MCQGAATASLLCRRHCQAVYRSMPGDGAGPNASSSASAQYDYSYDYSQHEARGGRLRPILWGSLPPHSRLFALLAAHMASDQGEFTEGHELDRKWRVPKE